MSTGAALSIRSPPPRLLVSRTGGAGGLSSSLDISSGGYRSSPWSSSSLSPDYCWLPSRWTQGTRKRPPERFAALLSHETWPKIAIITIWNRHTHTQINKNTEKNRNSAWSSFRFRAVFFLSASFTLFCDKYTSTQTHPDTHWAHTILQYWFPLLFSGNRYKWRTTMESPRFGGKKREQKIHTKHDFIHFSRFFVVFSSEGNPLVWWQNDLEEKWKEKTRLVLAN